MIGDLFTFDGAARCPDGYDVRGVRLFPRTRATAPVIIEPNLYLEFSKLQPRERDILLFATRYGTLVTPPDMAAEHGEDTEVWYEAISAMHDAVNQLVAGKLSALCETINQELSYPHQPQFSSIEDPRTSGFTLPRATISGRRIQMRLVVPNLSVLLWLQLLDVVTRNPTARRCRAPRCGKWMIIGVGAHRAHRVTCSNTCKVAFSVGLRGRAIELHAHGKSDRAIVLRLRKEGWQPTGKPEQQIRKWTGRE
jgi:hypothetical protein